MSNRSTPETTKQVASITSQASSGKGSLPLRKRFDPAVLSLIVGLLDPESLTLHNILSDTIEKLFSYHWHVKTWADLMAFSSNDMKTALIRGNTCLPVEATASPEVVKKLWIHRQFCSDW